MSNGTTTGAPVTASVLDWATDYDIFDAGERVLMNFPAANRDPEVFPDADKMILDRQQNRHLAFGAGIHRCAGSNLARTELRVAIEEWLARIPEFAVVDESKVTWAGGQVRGPRSIPVSVG